MRESEREGKGVGDGDGDGDGERLSVSCLSGLNSAGGPSKNVTVQMLIQYQEQS